MIEIILSFFAAIGVVLLLTTLFDFIFYRKYESGFVLKMDMRGKDIEQIIFDLELIHTVRSKKSGEVVIASVEIVSDHNEDFRRKIYSYMKIFSIPGIVVFEEKLL